jgi:hypothetical protein
MTDALDLSRRSAKPMGSRKRAAPATLPANAAWLDHVTLSMAVDRSEGGADRDSHRLHLHLHHSRRHRRRVLYELTVQYAPSTPDASADEAIAWVVRRSFSEYVALQQRLLARLRPGHACHAECAWLYNVLKHHFPKKSLFCSACKVENRRKALMRVLTTVRASVINRGNLVCGVLRDSVCQEFAAFLLGDAATEGESSSSSGGSSRGSSSIDGKSAVAAIASAPLLTLASKRGAKSQSSTSLVSFASEASMAVLEAEDDITYALRERSSSSCSSTSSSTCDGLRHYYRRGSSSAASTTTSGSTCCRRQHRGQFRDDYALETPTHGAAVTCGCEQVR